MKLRPIIGVDVDPPHVCFAH